MNKVISKDGTVIAFDQSGNGPALILVVGALGVRSDPALVAALAPHFTVFNYDRRGRGRSGDTPPYAAEREVEDIEALIDKAGGTAFLHGLSSGAILALEAAGKLPGKVKKLALYEPPFIIDDSRPPVPEDYVEQLNAAIAAGRPGDAKVVKDNSVSSVFSMAFFTRLKNCRGVRKITHVQKHQDALQFRPACQRRRDSRGIPAIRA